MINRPITSLLGSAVPMAQGQLGYTRQPPMMNVPVPQIQTPSGLSSLLAPAPQQKPGMISGLLSGPGSSARYGALAKALTQNSATPMSFGQRLTGGLLAGSDAAAAQQEAAFERSLREDKMALEAEKIELEKQKVAKGEGPRPQDVTSFQYVVDPDGKSRGTYFDKLTRKTVYADTGEEVESGALPINQAELPDTQFFQKSRETLTTEEKALSSMDKYMQGLAQDPVGMERYFNKVMQKLTTAFDGVPTREEMATAINEGRLQGIIGQVREDVVGPGVMTEFDAIRIIMSLGGDYSVFQSPEVALSLISDTRDKKLSGYNELLGEYNRAFDTLQPSSALKRIYKKKEGFKPALVPNSQWFNNKGTIAQWNALSDDDKKKFLGINVGEGN